MELSVVVAVIRRGRLEQVEQKLQGLGVVGITVSKIKGYGEYHNFFTRDWMVDSIRIEIFTRKDKADTIAAAVMDAAHTGSPGDGIVAICPLEKFFNIRLRAEATPDHV